VNDELNQPLDVRPLTARWTLNPGDASATKGIFTPSPDGAYLVGALPKVKGDTVHVEVTVLKGRIWAPMEFYLPNDQNVSRRL